MDPKAPPDRILGQHGEEVGEGDKRRFSLEKNDLNILGPCKGQGEF